MSGIQTGTTTRPEPGRIGPSIRTSRRAWQLVPLPIAGLGAGVAWGIMARLWMRYISDDPGFSWSGTLFILGVSGLAGTSLAGVEALRRRGARAWRCIVAAPALLMFFSPGMIMLPTAVLGGLAVSGRGGRAVRYPAAVLAVAPLSVFVLDQDPVDADALPHSIVLTLAWYAVLCAGLAVGWSAPFRPRPPGAALPVTPPPSDPEQHQSSINEVIRRVARS